MRPRALLFAAILGLAFVALPETAEARLFSFDPIIPQGETATCPGGWGLLVTVINNIISLLITLVIVAVAPLMIAYAGFLWVVNPVNPAGREQARSVLWKAVIGIVISLSAYLIVSAVLAVLLPDEGEVFGTKWYNVITTSGDVCLDVPETFRFAPPPPVVVPPGAGLPRESDGSAMVTVGSQAVVSSTAVNVLGDILRAAGLTSATITSGRRNSYDQARIMYSNIEQYGIAHQKNLYGSQGDTVIDVYDSLKRNGKSEAEIRTAMQRKIDEIGCSNVSNHCSTRDVFDVAPSSISNQAAFEAAVRASPAVRRFIPPPTDPAYHIEL